MKRNLLQTPFFAFLIPVFFVTHGWVENFNAIDLADALLLIVLYTGAAGILYSLFYLLYRSSTKAALISSFFVFFFLFFGAIHDFFRVHAIFLHKYSILLPLLLLLSIALMIWLRKFRSLTRGILFLNILFSLYTMIDSGTLLWKTVFQPGRTMASHLVAGRPYKICDSCAKPDIYFLLFDEYSSNKTLKEVFHYDNSSLDSFLVGEQFQVQRNSRSNYFFTPYSMASIFNLSYIRPNPDSDLVTPNDILNIFDTIKNSDLPKFLMAQGYQIKNYSFFDLPGHPATFIQAFIPIKTKLITNRTLLHYLERDVLTNLKINLIGARYFQKKLIAEYSGGNIRMLAQAKEESRKSSPEPRFVYMHVFMPHYPYLYDSLLQKRDPQTLIDQLDESQIPPYLAYLPYTNACIRDLITTIKRNTNGKAVIIFMSDHGFRYSVIRHQKSHFFQNQNAVYFPDKDTHLFYDSISAVNQFRVVLNKLFHQNLPLLKDSVLFLREKQ